MGKNKNSDYDLKGYKDLEGISNKSLNFSLWFINNRKKFIIAIIVVLILVSAGFFMYSGYHYGYYLLEGKSRDEQMLKELSEYQALPEEYRNKNSAQNLIFYKPEILRKQDSFDIVNLVENPNQNYYAFFDYCFVQFNEEIYCDSSFVFPLEKKYLLALSQNLNASLSAELVIKNLSWSRVNLHIYPDWAKYYSEHLDFPLKDVMFKPSHKNQLSNKVSLDSLEFKITNNTAYNYWEVPLNIVILNGSKVVGANKYLINKFYSGESQSVNLVWPGNISQASEVKIQPSLNIIDPDIYISY
ncbi:MAG: hypothetical protein K9M44_00740 [Candidatus Pacebacteria bacterium]|nr:hypothetical protein [Candidatus Paceibacterota bacterium]